MVDEGEQEQGGFMQRIKESPRTVSALIIILIVAAAIYAFSGERSGVEDEGSVASLDNVEEATEANEGGSEEVVKSEEGGQAEEEADDNKGSPAVAAVESSEGEEDKNTEQVAEAERTNEGFVEVAQTGDGYTHLARRAANRWLSENQVDYDVTDEHRIFIEDYIQNHLGSDSLEVGESHTVTFDLIKEAVAAAGQLEKNQLQNLSKYTDALS